ncbi:MAG: hypothetical protein IPH12_15485 [Saprospirales bacterium]|nr:hypothetical protein [Saprospirales bacterium]MBK8923589.1 hypothetical protein [Saprospirales bacterium]
MTQRLLLLVGLWLPCFFNLTAQPVGFSLPVLNNVSAGTVITMPVSVSNFDSIVGTQFVIQWDTQVLSFLTVLNYNLANMSAEDFGLGDAHSGTLRFAWEAPSVSSGLSVPDGTAIFLLKFSVVGQINQGSSLVFTESPPTVFEVVQVGQPPLGMSGCMLANGYVAVGFTLSTDWLEGQNTLPVAISPNPFSVFTTAVFDLDSAADVQMILTDAAGHPVWTKRKAFSAGQHGMEIASDQLKENGIYYLILRTPANSCVRPLVKL